MRVYCIVLVALCTQVFSKDWIYITCSVLAARILLKNGWARSRTVIQLYNLRVLFFETEKKSTFWCFIQKKKIESLHEKKHQLSVTSLTNTQNPASWNIYSSRFCRCSIPLQSLLPPPSPRITMQFTIR